MTIEQQRQWAGTAADYAAVHADVSMQEDYDAAQRVARLRAVYRERRQRVEQRWTPKRGCPGVERLLWRVFDVDMFARAVVGRAEEVADARSIFAHPALPVASRREMPPPVPSARIVDGPHWSEPPPGSESVNDYRRRRAREEAMGRPNTGHGMI